MAVSFTYQSTSLSALRPHNAIYQKKDAKTGKTARMHQTVVFTQDCGGVRGHRPNRAHKNEGGYPSRSFFPREKQTERATGVGWTVNVKQQGDYTRQFFCVFLFPSPNAASGGGRLTKRCLVCYCQKEHSLPLKNPILLVITWRTEKSLKQVRESANSKDVRPKKTLRT